LLYFSLDFHQGLLSLAASHKATQVVVSPCFIYSSQDRASLFRNLDCDNVCRFLPLPCVLLRGIDNTARNPSSLAALLRPQLHQTAPHPARPAHRVRGHSVSVPLLVAFASARGQGGQGTQQEDQTAWLRDAYPFASDAPVGHLDRGVGRIDRVVAVEITHLPPRVLPD